MKTIAVLFVSLAVAAAGYAQNTYPWPATGSVGIGTTSPTSALEVNGAVTATGLIGFIAKAPDGYWGFNHRNYYAGQGGNVYNVGFSGGAIGIFNGSTTAEDVFLFNRNHPAGGYIVLKANNNVGIGTTSPGNRLEVSGSTFNRVTASVVADVQTGFQWKKIGTNATDWEMYVPAGSTDLRLYHGGDKVVFLPGGNVGIGTTSPTEKLSVNGKIRAKEVIVETTNWSDYVFADSYKLQSLAEVEQHIKTAKHLPGVPSAKEVAANGVSVGDMQAILLSKIEELTLHQIAQEKEQISQRAKLEAQAAKISSLEAENAQLKPQTPNPPINANQ